ncbi:MAG: hypothetical protein ASARMPRED_006982 [Alectoria sarmentosa]|nr:MAG: hypothetical protein ASARMPRED_006982 [Alectoria sarmentosa]
MAPLIFLALSVFTLLPSLSQADYSPAICPPPPAPQVFGYPTYNDCQHLIGDLRNRDNLLHVFKPVGMGRPTTPDQTLGEVTNYAWRNRVDLPILLATPVISRTQADGSQGWGMLWYRTLAAALADINLACVYGSTGGMRGGYKRTDTESNLVVVLYQLSSDYDRFVKAELAAGRLPVADGDGSPFKTSKPPVQNSPEGPLDDTATSAFREPNAQQVTGQICDQYCSSVNLCTGGDGCRCIADPWQYPGSGYFTGTCKLPYFDIQQVWNHRL